MFEPQQPVSLRALNRIIAGVIRQQFGFQRYWVQAEITSFNNRRGHCYLQLIEKEEHSDTICAEAKAIIWANNAGVLLNRFERETGMPLRDNLQVLCLVEVNYHERFGMSLIIHDIDAAFTLGKLEQARRKTIELLKQEGVFDLNRQLPIPAVIQKIAIISSEEAKGYEDFLEKLNAHPQQYRFAAKLFPALVQGNQAPAEIIRCIQKIQEEDNFDAVILVRGGGSILDLECFNDYQLAREVALCTIPVITGIGHTTNRSICDEVAAVDCITPTDVAFYLLQRMELFEVDCNHLTDGIIAYTNAILEREENDLRERIYMLSNLTTQIRQAEKEDLQELGYRFKDVSKALTASARESLHQAEFKIRHSTSKHIQSASHSFDLYQQKLKNAARRVLQINENDLLNTENKIRLTDPAEVLRRGYSYTLVNGKPFTEIQQAKAGDELITVVNNGRITSTVKYEE